MGVEAEVRRPETGAEDGAGCAVEARPRGRRVAGLAGAVVALLACGAYAVGWIGETTLLFVIIGFVVYARATMGWFG